MKKIIIILLVIAILGGGTYILFFNKKQTQPPPSNGGVFPITPPSHPTLPTTPGQKTFVINTDARPVEINNFIDKSTPEGNNIFLMEDNEEYLIFYDANAASFSIVITGQALLAPLEEATIALRAIRQEAEIALLQTLRISTTDMCILNISLSVPAATDPILAGEYGISFCPDGIPF